MMLSNLNLLATAPGGVARLRELILTLAVQGKLVPQDPADEPASVLLQKIRAEKDRLIAEGKIKKDKPLPPIAEEEKPFELPVGWEWVRLGELVNLTYGKNLPTTSLTEDGFQVFGANGVIGRYKEYLYEEEQLLISCRGAYSGKPNISPEKCFVTNNSIVCEFFARSMVNLPFVYRQLQIADKSRLVTGSAQPQVTVANADPLVLAVPPLPEQSRIVTRVEELMRLCDALEAKGQLEATQHAQLLSTLLGTLTASATPEELADNWQRVAQHFDLLLDRPQAIDALEQTLLQLAVRGLLVPQDPADEPASVLLQKIRAEKDRLIAAGQIKRDKPLPPVTDEEKPFELPVGWEWIRLGEIAQANTGFAFKSSEYTSKGTLVFRVTNIKPDGSVDLSDSKYIDVASAATTYKKFLLSEGDVLLVMVGGSLGKIGVIEGFCLPAVLNQNMWKIVSNGAVDKKYLIDVLRYVNAHQLKITHSTHGHLAQGEYLLQPVALPPLAEQSRIVTRVTQLRRLCFELRQRLAEREAVQARLAEALVQQVA